MIERSDAPAMAAAVPKLLHLIFSQTCPAREGQNAGEPMVFYGHEDGKKRELVITNVTRDSVIGYFAIGR